MKLIVNQVFSNKKLIGYEFIIDEEKIYHVLKKEKSTMRAGVIVPKFTETLRHITVLREEDR